MTATYEEYVDAECSLTFEEMQEIHSQMIAEIGSDADAAELYQELVSAAVKYAAIRAEWPSLDREQKVERDAGRTSCHDSFIIKCNMLARYGKMQGREAGWRGRLGDVEENPYNRKRIGDFACYLAFVIGLNAR